MRLLLLAWAALAACGKPRPSSPPPPPPPADRVQALVDRVCACTTPECNDVATAELDQWLFSDEYRTSGPNGSSTPLRRPTIPPPGSTRHGRISRPSTAASRPERRR